MGRGSLNAFKTCATPSTDHTATTSPSTTQLSKCLRPRSFLQQKTFSKKAIGHFLNRCEELRLALPHYNIVAQMIGAVAGIYYLEGFEHLPPNPALYGSYARTPSLGAIRVRIG